MRRNQSIILYITLLALCFEKTIIAYPNGAPNSACGTLEPVGHFDPWTGFRTGTGSYKITLDKATYQNGGDITISLSGTSPFKGFAIQAVKSGSSSVVGTFTKYNVDNTQVMTCSNQADTATQLSDIDKTSIDLTWKAPSAGNDALKFRATFVKTRTEVYYVESNLLISQENNITSSPRQGILETISSAVENIFGGDNKGGGTGKGCSGAGERREKHRRPRPRPNRGHGGGWEVFDDEDFSWGSEEDCSGGSDFLGINLDSTMGILGLVGIVTLGVVSISIVGIIAATMMGMNVGIF